VVILTSNRTRELHEALRRRCVYHFITYPAPEREAQIIMLRASSVAVETARAVVAAVGRLRREPLTKPPGISEAVDWAEAATVLAKGGASWPDAFRLRVAAVGSARRVGRHQRLFVSGREWTPEGAAAETSSEGERARLFARHGCVAVAQRR
jgi:MoxR-like ATPase